MRRVVPLALVVVLASCTSGTPKAAPSASPIARPTSASASAPTSRSLVLAVQTEGLNGLELYRVDAARKAHLWRTVLTPEGFDLPVGLTLSAGVEPDLCVVWPSLHPTSDAGNDNSARCYPEGAGDGLELPAGKDIDVFALDPAGHRVFWSEVGEDQELRAGVVADYADGAVSRQRSFEADCERYLLSAAWAGASGLVVHCTSGDNDDPGELSTVELGGTSGPRLGHLVGSEEQFGEPAPWDGTSVLAVERQCDARCQEALKTSDVVGRQARVVRVDLRTGRVVEVVATAAAGRFVDVVTGGPHGVVYGTRPEAGHSPLKVYLRWPGEKHGAPVTGLPANVESVVAQP